MQGSGCMNQDFSDIRFKYKKLTETLIEKKLSITTMESITSGQIASLITDTEGSSAVLKGAFVTYSNEAKILQGVPAETIEKYGVYSCETAEAMAAACRKAYGADIGIGVTGSAGNADPNNADSVPGEVYYAVAMADATESRQVILKPESSRYGFKMKIADIIADRVFALFTE